MAVAAGALAVALLMSSPAAAQDIPNSGGGGFGTTKPWDTDNLRYAGGQYSARSFNVPFHQYGGYSETACQSGVADAFFQAGGSVGAVNDFPYLGWVTDADGNEIWTVQEGGTRSSGCDKFVEQQDEMAAQIVGNGGYYLDSSGKLRKLDSVPSRFSGRSLVYGDWDSKGSTFSINSGTGEVQVGDGYLGRVDGYKKSRAIYPYDARWTVPEGTRDGRFGGQKSWHGTAYKRSSGDIVRVARPVGGVVSGGYLPIGAGLCPGRFHPRGEDSVERIGSHTGRTLTGLTHARGKTADLYWCRSDLRFARAFETQNHGVALHPAAEGMTGAFQSYGRLNCYYTAIGAAYKASGSSHSSLTRGIHRDSSGGLVCSYLFPIPQCDPDTDNGSDSDWRDYTAEELKDIADDLGSSEFDKDEGEACPPEPAPDPQDPTPRNAASFSDPACVTATLSIYENRVSGTDAAPGVIAADQTLAVGAGRTAWDLDITSPYHATASPPRRNGDATGCADGSEDRTFHSTLAGHPLRKQSPVPSYASSDRTDTAAPPNDADGDIDYSGAVKNIAHRYASKVAENTCAAKRTESEAELALLEAREDAFTQWLSGYRTSASTNASRMGGYTRAAVQSGSGLAVLWFNDAEAAKASYAGRLRSRYSALSSALAAAKTAYDRTTDRTAGSNRAAVIAGGDNSCASHYNSETARLKTLFTSAETSALGNGTSGISEERTAVSATRLTIPAYPVTATTTNSYTVPDISAMQTRAYRAAYCSSGRWFLGVPNTSCVIPRDCREGESLFQCTDTGTLVPAVPALYRCYGGRYTVSGWVSGSYKTHRRSRGFSATYTAPARGSGTSSVCPGYAVQSGSTFASDARAYVMGTANTGSVLPSTVGVPASPAALGTLDKASLLGSYHPSHAARADLTATAASDRAAAGSLTLAVGTVPAGSPQKITDYQTAYKTAYDNAYTQATTDMGSTATTSTWNSFDWRYETSTLAWSSYQEDPATTYSGWVAQAGETEADRDGTGCDLIAVAADGSVSVEATRLDYETSSYGKGNVYSTRSDAQRTCKIRRTRTPELLLEYQPNTPRGADTSKTSAFWHVSYHPPVTAAEKFKLQNETEVFAVKTSLSDSSPVLCFQPGSALVAHVGAKGIDAVHKAVFHGATGFTRGIKAHCYRSSAQLASRPQPAFAFFDDTAHSAMDSVSVVWQQPNPKIVSKLGSTDDLKMMANSVALVANAVAYADATRTSSFYGTYYTFPTDSSTESPSGWDITGHPTLTLTSTFRQHVAQAKDAAAKTPTTHTMVFKFVDCVFGIEDVAFVDNIASPYALLSKDGVVPSGWKQTYDSDPHSSPTWYYPAFSTYEGALRLDGRRDRVGNPVTYGRNTQGGFSHPSYDLENTPADGMGWGVVYEDKVGKQQPVWAIYAPPVPGDNTLQAIQVCGADNLGAGGANPVATTGIPAARRTGTPASAPPASGTWAWKNTGWNYQDNPVMLWSVDDDPDRDDPWETKVSDSSAYLPRKPHNNLQFATEDSDVATMDVFQDASNPAPSGYSRLEDQDMVLANFAMVNLEDLESNPNPARGESLGLRERAQRGGITCGYNWWYCFRPAPAGYRLWGKEWMSKRQLCVGFNFKLHRWSTTADDVFVSTLDNTDRNERAIPIRLRLGYIVGGTPRPGKPHPDSYYEKLNGSSPC